MPLGKPTVGFQAKFEQHLSNPERNDKWDERFLALAEHIGQWSKDASTKVGAVIVDGRTRQVLTTGYNGFPRNVDESDRHRHRRPQKYDWTEHAERNAIYQAARHGIRLEGVTIYTAFYPCTDCARAIIQAGLKCLVTRAPDFLHERWGESFRVSHQMFKEAVVQEVWR